MKILRFVVERFRHRFLFVFFLEIFKKKLKIQKKDRESKEKKSKKIGKCPEKLTDSIDGTCQQQNIK
jgi:hypothetical protein